MKKFSSFLLPIMASFITGNEIAFLRRVENSLRVSVDAGYDVWVKEKGEWKLAAIQGTLLTIQGTLLTNNRMIK